MKYVIGSGWWCDTTASSTAPSPGRVTFGDDEIRSADFHHDWYTSIRRNASPEKIIIVDSCSPTQPPINTQDPHIEYISLNENAGHSSNHLGKYCGWTRSVLVSMSYALNCDCDYFVYVEQDTLLHGKGLIEAEIEKLSGMIAVGQEPSLIQPLQQSFFIIRQEAIEKFLIRFYRIHASDNRISPERKFAIASSGLLSSLPEFLFLQPGLGSFWGKAMHRVQTMLLKALGRFDTLGIGYGRQRPINFSDPHFYFQHASKSELERYNALYSDRGSD